MMATTNNDEQSTHHPECKTMAMALSMHSCFDNANNGINASTLWHYHVSTTSNCVADATQCRVDDYLMRAGGIFLMICLVFRHDADVCDGIIFTSWRGWRWRGELFEGGLLS